MINKSCDNCEHKNNDYKDDICKTCFAYMGIYRHWELRKIDLPRCRCTIGVAKMKKKDIYNKAKQVYGIDTQVTKAVEELAELQKELCKFLLDDGNMEHITEEIADVKVMIEQLELIFECKDKVKLIKKAKIQRLSDSLDEEQPKHLTFDCADCQHNGVDSACDGCINYSKFKKMVNDLNKKSCNNCLFRQYSSYGPPCFECEDHSKWKTNPYAE